MFLRGVFALNPYSLRVWVRCRATRSTCGRRGMRARGPVVTEVSVRVVALSKSKNGLSHLVDGCAPFRYNVRSLLRKSSSPVWHGERLPCLRAGDFESKLFHSCRLTVPKRGGSNTGSRLSLESRMEEEKQVVLAIPAYAGECVLLLGPLACS
jgi:hypothetical protein